MACGQLALVEAGAGGWVVQKRYCTRRTGGPWAQRQAGNARPRPPVSPRTRKYRSAGPQHTSRHVPFWACGPGIARGSDRFQRTKGSREMGARQSRYRCPFAETRRSCRFRSMSEAWWNSVGLVDVCNRTSALYPGPKPQCEQRRCGYERGAASNGRLRPLRAPRGLFAKSNPPVCTIVRTLFHKSSSALFLVPSCVLLTPRMCEGALHWVGVTGTSTMRFHRDELFASGRCPAQLCDFRPLWRCSIRSV